MKQCFKAKRIVSVILVLMMLVTSVQFSLGLIGSAAYSMDYIVQRSNFPVINISIQNGEDVDRVVKDNKKNATFEISNAGEYNMTVSTTTEIVDGVETTVWPMTIKGRGNSSWDFNSNKKPYNIKFSSKQNVLGMGKQKSYSLLANWLDTSFVRNFMAYKMGKKLNTQAMDCEIVELCINGKYEGLYLLTEKYGLGDTRIVTAGDGSDVDGDGEITEFLVEADSRALSNNEPNRFQSDLDVWFVIKEPDEEDILSSSDPRYIHARDTIQQADRAIRNGNYEDYIDIDSFIDVYLIQEFAKNPDFGYGNQPCYSSTFMNFEEGGKVHFGTIWDFDISMGRNIYDNSRDEGYRPTKEPTGFLHQNTYWVSHLLQKSEVQQKLKQRWTEMRDTFETMITELLPTTIDLVRPSAALDFEIWESPSQRTTTWNYRTPLDYEGETAYVTSFLTNRLAWLDDQWLIEATGITVNPTSVTLEVGETATVNATISPAEAANNKVVWSSSDESVATVDNGIITAVGAGNAQITATVDSVSAKVAVTVEEPEEKIEYSVFKSDEEYCYNSLFGTTQAPYKTIVFNNKAYVPMRLGAMVVEGNSEYSEVNGRKIIKVTFPDYIVEFGINEASVTVYNLDGSVLSEMAIDPNQTPVAISGKTYLPARILGMFAAGYNDRYSVNYVSNSVSGCGHFVVYTKGTSATEAQIVAMAVTGNDYIMAAKG